jgi:hypothetical protein
VIPSEYWVSQSIRLPGVCGRRNCAFRHGSGKAGAGGFVRAWSFVVCLRYNDPTTTHHQH